MCNSSICNDCPKNKHFRTFTRVQTTKINLDIVMFAAIPSLQLGVNSLKWHPANPQKHDPGSPMSTFSLFQSLLFCHPYLASLVVILQFVCKI